MLENVRLSFQGIWSHKMRSFLTMLGIIIGIASIISIVSTIKGTNEEIKNNLIGSGNNTVEVVLYQNGYTYTIYSESDIPHGIREVTDEVREQIRDLESVENVTCYNERRNTDSIFYLNNEVNGVSIRGIDTDYFSTTGYTVHRGRNFIEDDYKKFRKVLILDQTAADTMFQNEDPIGKTIEISKVPFTIIGIVDAVKKFTPTISTVQDYYSYMSEDSGTIYMPKASWPIVYSYDEPENVIVRAASVDDMENAGRQTADILNKTISPTQTETKYKADDVLERAQRLQDLSSATNNQLIWIASISLLVGGIGVMNIMLVSVTERTSEIGLKKAIGAQKGSILGQFLTEAAVLTSIGGIIGVASGIGMAQIINKVSGVAVSISVPASAVAVLFSMLIGIIFGLLPSVKAANLDPIEALRRE
ncbi:MAG: FtsX-like permease family protein [Lachnospiraceae bacterium]|nr:FtsX-like permease family protein [Lachnospiraceae bacterium]RKJ47982.1 FtsX-like permease family protein [bacterium 1XD42-54]